MNERERIELLMKCYDLSPSQFADRTGIQRASVSHIISGRNKPSLEVMLKIYDAFPGLDMKWLMTGDGEVPVRGGTVAAAAGGNIPSVAADVISQPQISAIGGLFAEQPEQKAPSVQSFQSIVDEPKPRRSLVQQPVREKPLPDARPRRQQSGRAAQIIPQQSDRKIKEIRIYYSDGTYETLVPER